MGEVTERSVHERRVPVLLAAIICLTALIAAACGSSDSESGGTTDGTAPELSADVTIAPDGAPTTGGTLIYGLEAESDGYNPCCNRFAPAGTQVGLAIYDPLAAFDADNKPVPYLAESMTPSADNVTWTFTARPNITFHNGEPLNGEQIQEVARIANGGDFASGAGGYEQRDVSDAYVADVARHLKLSRPVKIVLDGGNGVAGPIGLRTFEAIGCEVVPLFIEPDGRFPNHHPDPLKEANLAQLIAEVGA